MDNHFVMGLAFLNGWKLSSNVFCCLMSVNYFLRMMCCKLWNGRNASNLSSICNRVWIVYYFLSGFMEWMDCVCENGEISCCEISPLCIIS